METIEASVIQVEEKRFLRIGGGVEEISIPMSDDKPNEVKSAFNKLIGRLRKGVFEIKMAEVGDDLFSQVANEYIAQLNREIQEVHREMERYSLTVD